MTKLAAAFLFVTLSLAKLAAAATFQAKPFNEVFAESLRHMGGESELSKIQSITALAHCTGPRGEYVTEIYSQRGNRLQFKQVWPEGRSFLAFVNGEHAWMEDAMSGHVSQLDSASTAGIRAHEFQMIPLVLPERYQNPVVEREEDFAGERCIKIRMIDGLGKSCAVFFKTRSSLLAGWIQADTRSDKGETVRIVFNEWKKIGNVMLPSKVTATDKSGDWVLAFHDIKLNEVDEKIFAVPPSIAAVKELRQLLQQGRSAHFGKDAGLLVSVFAEDFISIDAGKISRPAREESRNRLQTYFDRSEFLEWDDISPPIIRVSQDASMAYVIVHKRVRLKAKNEEDELEEETTIFAWTETYEKQNDKWTLTSVTSTRKPTAE
ncbi:nuclear transport factor 2 family protein [candidate division KSB1 bacterium]|nr:nuclear transport factor 2 family protein [candidate division KSB1 bacterium]